MARGRTDTHATMKRLFKISAGEHGRGKVIVKWQPEGNLLATAGHNGELSFVVDVEEP